MPKEHINHRDANDGFVRPFGEVVWFRDKGHVAIGVLEGGDIDEAEQERGGYFVDLDRSEVNRLIRTLRKARDQAFGSDA